MLKKSKFDPKAINVYFVNSILMGDGAGGFAAVAGLGVAKPTAKEKKLDHPCIVMGDKAVRRVVVSGTTLTVPEYDTRQDASQLGNEIAHEIGHFFSLEHVEKAEKELDIRDTWSRRRLMYLATPMFGLFVFKNDVGFGTKMRGYLITQRGVGKLKTDDECKRARDFIDQQRGKLYDF
jgi:hypothetical protein